ncbi:ABC transporter substrate-binding protein [Candidatus Saccharibacteria bacterium]|nr:ABC transporter substrate-binding protein [Candidatus Saccharibacteria bacterium]
MPKFWKKQVRRTKYLGQDIAELSKRGTKHVRENVIGTLHKAHYVRRQVFWWLGAAVILLLMTGAQLLIWRDLTSTTISARGGMFSEATIGEIRSLNPLFATTNSEFTAINIIHARLIGHDQSGNLSGKLASSWTASADAREWRVTLREGLTFHDGHPLTAEDVVFTVELMQNPLTHYLGQSNWTNVRVSAEDDHTVIFTLNTSQASFAEQLAFFVLPKHILQDIPPQQLINADFNLTGVIGAGPFMFNRFKASSTSPFIVDTRRFDNFFAGASLLNSFEIHTFSSTEDIVDALNLAAVIASAELSPSDLGSLERRHNFRERRSLLSSGTFLFINTAGEQTSLLGVRQAIAASLDLTKIRMAANVTTPLDLPIITSRFHLNAPTLPPRSTGAEITEPLRLLASDREVAYVIASQLREANIPIELTIHSEGSQALWSAIDARDYDLLLRTIVMPSDPDPSQYYHSSQIRARNFSNFVNGSADIYLTAANATTDLSIRRARYEEFLRVWVNEIPAIGLYQSEMLHVAAHFATTFPENAVLATPFSRFETVNRYATLRSTRHRTP